MHSSDLKTFCANLFVLFISMEKLAAIYCSDPALAKNNYYKYYNNNNKVKRKTLGTLERFHKNLEKWRNLASKGESFKQLLAAEKLFASPNGLSRTHSPSSSVKASMVSCLLNKIFGGHLSFQQTKEKKNLAKNMKGPRNREPCRLSTELQRP